jgi:hypothetical protein
MGVCAMAHYQPMMLQERGLLRLMMQHCAGRCMHAHTHAPAHHPAASLDKCHLLHRSSGCAVPCAVRSTELQLRHSTASGNRAINTKSTCLCLRPPPPNCRSRIAQRNSTHCNRERTLPQHGQYLLGLLATSGVRLSGHGVHTRSLYEAGLLPAWLLTFLASLLLLLLLLLASEGSAQ